MLHLDNRRMPIGIMLACLLLYLFFLKPFQSVDSLLYEISVITHIPIDTARYRQDRLTGSYGTDDGIPPKGKALPTVSKDDVLLIIKTGATTLWKQLPIHLSTTLDPKRLNVSNVAIYSDLPESVGNFLVYDALENVSSTAKSSKDFDLYRQLPLVRQSSLYTASTNQGARYDDAADSKSPLDRFMYLPILNHAGTRWPKAKWYIIMEPDTYLFLPNILRQLASYDHRDPYYIGDPSVISNRTFAVGGGGVVLSRGAWDMSFGDQSDSIERYENYARAHGHGDHVLAELLSDHGIVFGGKNIRPGQQTGFSGVSHWKFRFTRGRWREPIHSLHHLQARDIMTMSTLEAGWDFSKQSFRECDLFAALVQPGIKRRVDFWDNLSSKYELTSMSSVPEKGIGEKEKLRTAWLSSDHCEQACQSWSDCVQWSHAEDRCRLDDAAVWGTGLVESWPQMPWTRETTSGWILDRIAQWTC